MGLQDVDFFERDLGRVLSKNTSQITCLIQFYALLTKMQNVYLHSRQNEESIL